VARFVVNPIFSHSPIAVGTPRVASLWPEANLGREMHHAIKKLRQIQSR
jgi:hypothetical protein